MGAEEARTPPTGGSARMSELWAALLALAVLAAPSGCRSKEAKPPPAGGEPVASIPEYMSGDECLFCHREKVGVSWQGNAHRSTVREAAAGDPALLALASSGNEKPGGVDFLLGGKRLARFLRKKEYGRLELLSTAWTPDEAKGKGRLIEAGKRHWDRKKFSRDCGGCHATGFDSSELRFMDISIDCYACHGDVDRSHANDPKRVFLAAGRSDSKKTLSSACAQCHARGGRSRSTKLPFPNNFIAGRDLFVDFEVDTSPGALRSASKTDQHILESIRDVSSAMPGALSCLDCHQVHPGSTRKHRRLSPGAYCESCHGKGKPGRVQWSRDVHNETCGY